MKAIHQDKLDQGRNFYCAHFLSLVAFSFVLGFFFEIEIFPPILGICMVISTVTLYYNFKILSK